MKIERLVTCLSIGILFAAISIISFPKNLSATEDGKRYLGTTCQTVDASWRCNDCIKGNFTCGDNSCIDCMPPDKPIIKD